MFYDLKSLNNFLVYSYLLEFLKIFVKWDIGFLLQSDEDKKKNKFLQTNRMVVITS